ncbi:hypothetical protein ACJ41O_010310 [Fusarium nematophilum]
MLFSTILPFIAFGLGVANAAAIDDDNMFDTRAPQCPDEGIKLIKLDTKGGVFIGVGKPGKCQNLPRNVNDFDPRKSKSLVRCFDCSVFLKKDCHGGEFILEGDDNPQFKSSKRPKYKSWRCDCKD